MPQKKGESQEQYMDRIRAVRGLGPMMEDPEIMGRTRAAVAYISTAPNERIRNRLSLSAFMSIFHPEVKDETVREMLRE